MILPWPARVMHPNARPHWRTLASAKRRAKRDAYYLTLEAVPRFAAARVTVRYKFYPPSFRHYDTDNLVASMKAAADGIAAAIRIDDSKWVLEIAPRGPVTRNGKVVVELEWEP